MDRRQRKTRAAIFDAFISLLAEKSFNHITVAEIIEKADVGRATFYAHFETKDFLLQQLCEELFCHVFDCMNNQQEKHHHIFSCDAPDSVYLHLFEHLLKNDNHILDLLSGQNNELFLGYFKSGLTRVIESQVNHIETDKDNNLPADFVINHIASTFVETVKWWLKNKMKETPEEIHRYFVTVINYKSQEGCKL